MNHPSASADLLELINAHSATALAVARLKALGIPIEPRSSPLLQLVTEGLEAIGGPGVALLLERAWLLRSDRDQPAAVMMLVSDYETLLSDLQQVAPREEWAPIEQHLSSLGGEIAAAAADHAMEMEDLLADNLQCNLELVYPSYGR